MRISREILGLSGFLLVAIICLILGQTALGIALFAGAAAAAWPSGRKATLRVARRRQGIAA